MSVTEPGSGNHTPCVKKRPLSPVLTGAPGTGDMVRKRLLRKNTATLRAPGAVFRYRTLARLLFHVQCCHKKRIYKGKSSRSTCHVPLNSPPVAGRFLTRPYIWISARVIGLKPPRPSGPRIRCKTPLVISSDGKSIFASWIRIITTDHTPFALDFAGFAVDSSLWKYSAGIQGEHVQSVNPRPAAAGSRRVP